MAGMTELKPPRESMKESRRLSIWRGMGWTFLLWAGSLWLIVDAVRDAILAENLPDLDDTTALLFGASTIALGVFALIAGGFALFGWQTLKEDVKKDSEQFIRERIGAVEQEVRGRSYSVMGYVIGENSVNEESWTPSNEERLREAMQHCDQAYRLLKGSGLPTEFMALNNYLYYACIIRDKPRRGYLLECARRLREAAEEHDSPNLLLTYARTVLEFSPDPEEVAQACAIVNDLHPRTQVSTKQRREADYLASLCEQRARNASDRLGN